MYLHPLVHGIDWLRESSDSKTWWGKWQFTSFMLTQWQSVHLSLPALKQNTCTAIPACFRIFCEKQSRRGFIISSVVAFKIWPRVGFTRPWPRCCSSLFYSMFCICSCAQSQRHVFPFHWSLLKEKMSNLGSTNDRESLSCILFKLVQHMKWCPDL